MTIDNEIAVCLGSSCFSRGNKETVEAIKAFLKLHDLEDSLFFRGDLCTGHCENGPVMRINGQLYEHLTPDSVIDILTSNFNNTEAS